MKCVQYPCLKEWEKISERPVKESSEQLKKQVEEILNSVRSDGAEAVRQYSEKFDKRSDDKLLLSKKELSRIELKLPQELQDAFHVAIENVRRFHATEQAQKRRVEIADGIVCEEHIRAIDSVGLYIPGGKTPLFSTLIMLGVPARLAGCGRIVVATAPVLPEKRKRELYDLDPAILYLCQHFEVDELLIAGGAQAIGALAYGIDGLEPVAKIFGPGNSYVTEAKVQVSQQGTAIDMPAGPSEILIIADESADIRFLAADMLAQAEHGPDSQAIVLTNSLRIFEMLPQEIAKHIKTLPRSSLAEQSLSHSVLCLCTDLEEASLFTNVYAPEHLSIQTKEPERVLEHIDNAASIFLGHVSAESAGDYASGTNHVLPTLGYAKSMGGINTASFQKRIFVQSLTKKGLQHIEKAIVTLARAEGLEGHARSVLVRRHA